MIDELMNPDEIGNSQFDWDKEIQKEIMVLIIHDKQFFLQTNDLIKASYFPYKAYSTAYGIITEHWANYKTLPKKPELFQEMKERLKNDKALPSYLGDIESLYEFYEPGLDSREYLSDKILLFAKLMAFRQAWDKSVSYLKKDGNTKDTWGKIYATCQAAFNVDRNFDAGLYYNTTREDRYGRMKQQEGDAADKFILGHPSLDTKIKGGGWRRGELISVMAESGVGKCYAKNTLILMFNGTTKKVQDIKAGDLVMGDDGTARTVLNTHTGKSQLYDVIPTKGEKYTVNAEHILVLRTGVKYIDKKHRCNKVKFAGNPFETKDGFVEISVKDYLNQSQAFKRHYKGVRANLIPFEKIKVAINPYILGCWLGDGTSRRPEITTQDDEILNAFYRESCKRSLNLIEIDKNHNSNAKTYGMTYKPGKSNSLLNDLRFYSLIKNKHVPLVYKINSISVRKQILAGLLDTDGSKSNNCFDFINKNKQLAEDVVYIARSLGLAAYMKPCVKKSQNGTAGKYYRVTISGNTDIIPTRIKHKICKKRKQVKNVLNVGIQVKEAGVGEYYGFETDGNHRFLLADFTIVHNSICLTNMACENAKKGYKVCYISVELSEDRIAERFDSIFTGVNINILYDQRKCVFDKLDGLFANYTTDKDRVVVKWFPPKSANVNTIRAYLNQLKFYGFVPDIVIIDYIGEMKLHPNMDQYESLETIVSELRGLAGEENIFAATAMQPNRSGKQAIKEVGYLDESHLANGHGQVRPLDCLFSLNQNDYEALMRVGKVHVAKQRSGQSKYQYFVRFDKENLRIYEISHEEYKNAMSKGKEKAAQKAIDYDSIHESVESSYVPGAALVDEVGG